MADNSEAGGSQPRGEEPIEQNSTIQMFIADEVTKTLTSLFPTICESVRVWIEGGRKGPPPVISFGSNKYSINVATEDAPPASPEVKKKKHRKRSKPASKTTIWGYEDMVSPRVDGLTRVHEPGQLILTPELLRLADGCMLSL